MWLLLVSILANYVLGLVMDKTQTVGARRTALILGILANLGILGYYKYFNFFINTLNKVAGRELLSMKDIALPLGVSFFTFQAMSYLIDLYKKILRFSPRLPRALLKNTGILKNSSPKESRACP